MVSISNNGQTLGVTHESSGTRSVSVESSSFQSPLIAADDRSSSQRFYSILFENNSNPEEKGTTEEPTFFHDLNLDQIVEGITANKQEYNLKPFFHQPLTNIDAVAFRHEIFRDLEQEYLHHGLKQFAQAMRDTRHHLAEAEKVYYEHQKERWFIDAINLYCESVNRLTEDLSSTTLASRGLKSLRQYLTQYVSSEAFVSLYSEATRFDSELSAIRYNILINGRRVEIHRFAGEEDFSAQIEAVFERFRQTDTSGYDFRFADYPEMNYVEARILDGVVQLYPKLFSEIADYCEASKGFFDPTIVDFDRQIQFYLAYLEYIDQFKRAGLTFCYPRVTTSEKEICDYQGFDLALATALTGEHKIPICNDFFLNDPERIIIVSGPNQGGKTTFSRMFGQIHYLASLGCLVPGTKAQLYLPDQIFTHFEREEQMTNLRGKLEDDLIRIDQILRSATASSIVIINEIFASTTLQDAVFLGQKIATALSERDALCVWVTFIDELASFGPTTVSMMSTVKTDNPTQRSFKILRLPANGMAYAMALAQKYELTYATIKNRIGS